MTMDLYRKIINEAAEIPPINRLIINGLGEPLLDRYLEERIHYAKSRRNWPVAMFTNGVYLTPARFRILAEAGLDEIVVSLNAVRAEQHEEIMGLKGKFELVVENCDYVIDHFPQLEIHAVCNDTTFTRLDMVTFYKTWGRVGEGGHGLCVVEGNWAGDMEAIRPFEPNQHCSRATRYIYVLFDGKVTTCCFDPTGKMVFGDLSKQTLREVYNGTAYLQFRQDHVNDEADFYDICRNCTRI